MFQWLFGRRRARRAVVDTLYDQIVAAARQPTLYLDWQVPDTALGRFEMLSLHMFLFLHRARGETGVVGEVAQDLTDEFFRDVEHSLRELGIGDMGVPKRMKKLARMFYGRAAAYGEAIDAGDSEALAEALRRNVKPESAPWSQSRALASYVMAANARLAATPRKDLLAGRLPFRPSVGEAPE